LERCGKNFRNFQCGLQNISIGVYKNHFFGPVKNRAVTLYKATFDCMKNVNVNGISFDSFFKASWLYACLKNFTSIGIVQRIGKKIVNTKKSRMIQNTKLLRI